MQRLMLSIGLLIGGVVLVPGSARAQTPAAEGAYNEGTLLLKDGRLPEAIARFRQAVQLNPDLGAAHFNLGLAYEQSDSLTQAIGAYKEAIRCKPEGTYHLSLGLAYRRKGMLTEAIEAYLKAAQLLPGDPKVAYNLGNAYLEKSALPDAIASYEKALKLKYATPSAIYLNMGIAHQKQGHKAEAISAYEAYLKAAPQARNAQQIREVVKGLRAAGGGR